MIKNYVKVALRNLVRQKAYSFINIFGFAIGMAVCLLITFYVYDDLSWDRFHSNSDEIYRLLTEDVSTENLTYGITSGPLVLALPDGLPEVEASTRITADGRGELFRDKQEGDPTMGDTVMGEPVAAFMLLADEGFFDVFDFKIEAGNIDNPLSDPNGVYITREKATLLFGDENPIGQPIRTMNTDGYYVAGIVQAPPSNTSIYFDCIVPLNLEWNPVWWNSWTNVALTGYIRLSKAADPNLLEPKIVEFAKESGFAKIWEPRIQKLTDVHLNSSNLRFDTMNWGKSDKAKVTATGIIALLVLLIASINFINLSSARATKRAKEVGMRKIVGSRRRDLIFQFLGESLLITWFAAIIAIAIFELTIPYLNSFMHRQTTLSLLSNPEVGIILAISITMIGLIAGFYPALILSNFRPLDVLNGKFKTSKKGIIIRRILVVSQFTVSISLISAVFIVKSQIDYLNDINIGYNRDNVINIDLHQGEQFASIKNEISNISGVESVGLTSSFPGGTLIKFQVFPDGMTTETGAMFDRMTVDEGLIPTLKMELLYGNNFEFKSGTENDDKVIINESALKYANWEGDPIGRTINVHREDQSINEKIVIGVVKDFNFTTTRRNVNPMFLTYGNNDMGLLVRTNGENNSAFLEEAKRIFQKFYPEEEFGSQYLNDIFNHQFNDDYGFATFIAIFSILAIIISSLGLLGLSSFMTEQRRREIGIRKVLGSTVFQIVKLLSFEFTRWVVLAKLMAWPLTWFAMNIWLQEFVYKMNMNVGVFVYSGLGVVLVALITISAQTIIAANGNPVKALKWE